MTGEGFACFRWACLSFPDELIDASTSWAARLYWEEDMR